MRNRTYTNMKRACLMLLAAALAVAGCKKENVDGDGGGNGNGNGGSAVETELEIGKSSPTAFYLCVPAQSADKSEVTFHCSKGTMTRELANKSLRAGTIHRFVSQPGRRFFTRCLLY